MCWQTRYKTKLKVAEDNIPVTKIVRVSSDIIQDIIPKSLEKNGL